MPSRITYYLLVLLYLSGPVLLSACNPSPPLNSERIAQRYGNYGIEVLQAGDSRRTSSLFSMDAGHKTMRTLALVEFAAGNDPLLATEHRRILAGESIGTVFKESGWTISKVSSHVCQAQLGLNEMPELSRMEIVLPATLASHQYVFRVHKGEDSIDYAIITEIHHPDYLRAADLGSGDLVSC
jgi:hypothetical protein